MSRRKSSTLHSVPAADKPTPASNMAQARDGYANLVTRTGLGAGNQLSAGTYLPVLLTRNRLRLENMLRGSWIVGAAIEAFPEDMTRAGIEIISDDEPSDIAKVQRCLNIYGVWSALQSNLKWGRLYGGSIAYIDIDGQEPSTPLDVSTVGEGQFKGLRVYDRWQLSPDVNNLVPSGPDAGLPAYYALTTIDSGNFGAPVSGVRFHHTRCIRAIGIQLPFFQAITEMMWGESILERMQDRLMAFDAASMGAANLLERAYLRTVQIDGLREIIAAGGQSEANLRSMFADMRFMQNNEGMSLIDAKDTFTGHSYTFAGIDDVIMQFAQQLSGACGIPLSRLFGQAPKGLNATGEGDMRIYHENVNGAQESMLRDGLTTILSVVYRSELGRDIPEDASFKFKPLRGLDDTERAAIATANTATVLSAFESGAIEQATTLMELQNIGQNTGVFTNITDEHISEAEKADEAPPPPVVAPPMMPPGEAPPEAPPPEAPPPEAPPPTTDSVWNRWLARVGR
jgi:hypothetical protein